MKTPLTLSSVFLFFAMAGCLEQGRVVGPSDQSLSSLSSSKANTQETGASLLFPTLKSGPNLNWPTLQADGNQQNVSLQIQNVGTADAYYPEFTLMGGTQSKFKVLANDCTPVLRKGQRCYLVVSFASSSSGNFSDVLKIKFVDGFAQGTSYSNFRESLIILNASPMGASGSNSSNSGSTGSTGGSSGGSESGTGNTGTAGGSDCETDHDYEFIANNRRGFGYSEIQIDLVIAGTKLDAYNCVNGITKDEIKVISIPSLGMRPSQRSEYSDTFGQYDTFSRILNYLIRPEIYSQMSEDLVRSPVTLALGREMATLIWEQMDLGYRASFLSDVGATKDYAENSNFQSFYNEVIKPSLPFSLEDPPVPSSTNPRWNFSSLIGDTANITTYNFGKTSDPMNSIIKATLSDGPVSNLSISLENLDGDTAFQKTGQDCQTSSECFISIQFNPASAKLYQATLKFSYTTSESSTLKSDTLLIKGEGLSSTSTDLPIQLSWVRPLSTDFGEVAYPTGWQQRVLEIENTGQGVVQIDAIDFTNTSFKANTDNTTCGGQIDQRCQVAVIFNPVSIGNVSGTLRVSYSSPTSGEQKFLSATLAGKSYDGTVPQEGGIAWKNSQVSSDWGYITPQSAAVRKTFFISKEVPQAIVVNYVSIQGAGSEAFQVEGWSGNNSTFCPVAGGVIDIDDCQFDVSFDTSIEAAYSAQLVVNYKDVSGTNKLLTLPLTATSIPPERSTLVWDSSTSGRWEGVDASGRAFYKDFTIIKNSSGGTPVVQSITLNSPGTFSIASNPCNGAIQSSCTFKLSFANRVQTDHASTLVVNYLDGAGAAQSISLDLRANNVDSFQPTSDPSTFFWDATSDGNFKNAVSNGNVYSYVYTIVKKEGTGAPLFISATLATSGGPFSIGRHTCVGSQGTCDIQIDFKSIVAGSYSNTLIVRFYDGAGTIKTIELPLSATTGSGSTGGGGTGNTNCNEEGTWSDGRGEDDDPCQDQSTSEGSGSTTTDPSTGGGSSGGGGGSTYEPDIPGAYYPDSETLM